MLGSLPSSPDTHDGHLRALLDQRTARANPNDRFSALSQSSDTPSVYSRAHFSPRIPERSDAQSMSSDYHHHYPPNHTADRLSDPHTTTLDFRADPRFSTTASETYDDGPHSFDDTNNDEQADRMSYLGPKMRFHSRAPWEMDADGLEEEEEPQGSPRPSGFHFSFGTGSKGNASTASSPRPSHSISRPSGDSHRSNVLPKRSFDTINSQLSSKGALYALAQESLSATSLVGGTSAKDGLLSKFSSLGRTRTPTNQSLPSPSPSSPIPPSPVRSPSKPWFQSQQSYVDTSEQLMYGTFDTNPASIPTSGYLAGESMHPYANPDLVVTYDDETVAPASASSQYPSFPRTSFSPAGAQTFSLDEIRPKSIDPSYHVQTPLTSDAKMRQPSIHGKGISSPIAVQGSALPPTMSTNPTADHGNLSNNLHGWTERVVPPSFSLISLEEARAQQARNSVASNDFTNTVSQSIASTAHEEFGISPPSSGTRRGRTLSTGTKAKNVKGVVGTAKPDRRDSEPAVIVSHPSGKSLKHKKSGFMRLFNGGKDKEEELPPPVPPLTSMLSMDGNSSWKKSTIPRVPVPTFTSVEYQRPALQHRSSSTGPTNSRPSPPALQIDTQSSHNGGNASDKDRGSHTVTPTNVDRPWLNGSQPQSAPADVSGFPALRLRPVSSLFGSHFEAFIPDLQSNASEQARVETPTSSSPNEFISPITPGVADTFSKTESVSPSTIIKSLREELASSKMASQRQIWKLEGQIKDLKLEVEELRSEMMKGSTYCEHCNRSSSPLSGSPPSGRSVLNRPRAKTGTGARFANAQS